MLLRRPPSGLRDHGKRALEVSPGWMRLARDALPMTKERAGVPACLGRPRWKRLKLAPPRQRPKAAKDRKVSADFPISWPLATGCAKTWPVAPKKAMTRIAAARPDMGFAITVISLTCLRYFSGKTSFTAAEARNVLYARSFPPAFSLGMARW